MSGRYASYWNSFLFGFEFGNILFYVHFILSEYVKLLCISISVFFNFGNYFFNLNSKETCMQIHAKLKPYALQLHASVKERDY